MIPDLGKYADTVLSSYVASIVLLGALVVFSILRGRKISEPRWKSIEQRTARDG